MKRSARLLKLLGLELSREREQARQLADAQRNLNERRLRLGELEGYLGDYKRQFNAVTGVPVPAVRVQADRAFLNRLSGIITQQSQAVVEAEQRVVARRDDWLQARHRVEALRKAVERLDREQAASARKQEQAVTDEAAQRTFKRH